MKGRLRATCVTCERPYYPLRRGLCQTCYKRGRRAAVAGTAADPRSPAAFLIEAARYESEGYPNTARTYREIAARLAVCTLDAAS